MEGRVGGRAHPLCLSVFLPFRLPFSLPLPPSPSPFTARPQPWIRSVHCGAGARRRTTSGMPWDVVLSEGRHLADNDGRIPTAAGSRCAPSRVRAGTTRRKRALEDGEVRREDSGGGFDLVDHEVQRVARDGPEDDGADAAEQAARALVLDDGAQRPPHARIGDGVAGREGLRAWGQGV